MEYYIFAFIIISFLIAFLLIFKKNERLKAELKRSEMSKEFILKSEKVILNSKDRTIQIMNDLLIRKLYEIELLKKK